MGLDNPEERDLEIKKKSFSANINGFFCPQSNRWYSVKNGLENS